MKNVRVFTGQALVLTVVLLMAFTILNCGGSDDKESAAPCTTCSNIAGSWTTDEYTNATACGEGTYWEYDIPYTITQNGCSLTVVPVGSGQSFSGQICNNTVSWSGSYPEDGGTTTLTVSLTVSGNTFTGRSNWTWKLGSYSCSGYTDVTGTKQ